MSIRSTLPDPHKAASTQEKQPANVDPLARRNGGATRREQNEITRRDENMENNLSKTTRRGEEKERKTTRREEEKEIEQILNQDELQLAKKISDCFSVKTENQEQQNNNEDTLTINKIDKEILERKAYLNQKYRQLEESAAPQEIKKQLKQEQKEIDKYLDGKQEDIVRKIVTRFNVDKETKTMVNTINLSLIHI